MEDNTTQQTEQTAEPSFTGELSKAYTESVEAAEKAATEATKPESKGQKRQHKAGSVPVELRTPSFDLCVFRRSESGKWAADEDNKGRKTGILRRAFATVTFPLAGSLTLTRTIWQERFKDRLDGQFKDRFSCTIQDRYHVRYADDGGEKLWQRWSAVLLSPKTEQNPKGGPFEQWIDAQAELDALQDSVKGADMSPRLVKTATLSEAEQAEFNSLIG